MLLQVFNYALNDFWALEDLVMTQPVGDQQLTFLQLLTYGNGAAYMDESVFAVVYYQDRDLDPLGPLF